MRERNRSRSSSLFLLELTLAILLFSIASAVCVQLFVQSHLLSRHAQELNEAVNECTSAAELVRAADSLEEAKLLFQQQYPAGEAAGSTEEPVFNIYYDESFTLCHAEDTPSYCLTAQLKESDGMLTAQLRLLPESNDLSANASAIYEINVQHYIGRGHRQ